MFVYVPGTVWLYEPHAIAVPWYSMMLLGTDRRLLRSWAKSASVLSHSVLQRERYI